MARMCEEGEMFVKENSRNVVCGSEAYASPEMFNSFVYSGTKNDIFSLGYVLFMMASGMLPFPEDRFNSMEY
jgi:serine/threonine protein kinase